MELYHYHIHTYTVEPCLAAIQYNKYSIFMLLNFIRILAHYMTIYHKAEMGDITRV